MAGPPFVARELLHPCERKVRSASARRTVSNRGECSSGNWRVLRALSNVESHTVRFVGDTDHGTMLETVATGAKQEWVRSFGTVGVRERTKNSGSMILDVASCVAAENGWQSGKVRGHVESTETSGGI